MSFTLRGLPRGYRYPQSQGIASFAGGLNIRDAASEIAATEFIDSWNVTLDERGGAVSRLGHVKYNNSPYPGGLVENVFWWEDGNHLAVQAGKDLYLDTATTPTHTFSVDGLVTFASFAGQLVASHPTDGMVVSADGATWATVGKLGTVTVTVASPAVFTLNNHGLNAGDEVYLTTTGALPTGLTPNTVYFVLAAGLTTNSFEVSVTAGGSAVNTSGTQSGTHTLFRGNAPKATAVCVWQNKLWAAVVGTPRLQFTAPGDPNNWPATSFVDLRDKDNTAVVALAVGSGLDISGAAGMLAFKRESAYRVNDSTTGAYQTLDATVGAAGPLAVDVVGSKVVTISEQGIHWWQNGLAGMQNASSQLEPLWDPSQINFAKLGLMAAGHIGKTARFSLAQAGSSVNDLCLEFHTEQGWIVARSDAASCYTVYGNQTATLVGGSPTATGQVYEFDKGGTDDGTAISGWLQTRWLDLLGGYKASVLHVRLRGRGTGTLEIRRDYQEFGDQQPFALTDTTEILYDAGLLYDTGLLYYQPDEEPSQTVFSVDACRQLSLRFTFSNSTTVTGPEIANSNVLQQRGPFGLFQVEALFMRLGINQ